MEEFKMVSGRVKLFGAVLAIAAVGVGLAFINQVLSEMPIRKSNSQLRW
ncbi:hypothetical protein [Weissella cibaria]|nr:hypothetical protein [Weissella cibaria]